MPIPYQGSECQKIYYFQHWKTKKSVQNFKENQLREMLWSPFFQNASHLCSFFSSLKGFLSYVYSCKPRFARAKTKFENPKKWKIFLITVSWLFLTRNLLEGYHLEALFKSYISVYKACQYLIKDLNAKNQHLKIEKVTKISRKISWKGYFEALASRMHLSYVVFSALQHALYSLSIAVNPDLQEQKQNLRIPKNEKSF